MPAANVARILSASMPLPRLSLAMILSTLAGCGPAATDGGFDSANPAAKLYAIEYAAGANDRAAIPDLVEQLDSDDPAVRALAIATLQRLTGQTKGYRDFDPPDIRRQAIAQWVQAVRDGEFAAHDASAPKAPESPQIEPTAMRQEIAGG